MLFLINKLNELVRLKVDSFKKSCEHLNVEYVEAKELAIRETKFISKYLPYYNVLKQGYSSLGYKHTEDTKQMLSELAKNRTHSDKTKA